MKCNPRQHSLQSFYKIQNWFKRWVNGTGKSAVKKGKHIAFDLRMGISISIVFSLNNPHHWQACPVPSSLPLLWLPSTNIKYPSLTERIHTPARTKERQGPQISSHIAVKNLTVDGFLIMLAHATPINISLNQIVRIFPLRTNKKTDL